MAALEGSGVAYHHPASAVLTRSRALVGSVGPVLHLPILIGGPVAGPMVFHGLPHPGTKGSAGAAHATTPPPGHGLAGSVGTFSWPHTTLTPFGVPQPHRNPHNGRAGGHGAFRATLAHGRAHRGTCVRLGNGQGFGLFNITPFNVAPVGDLRRYSLISFDVHASDLGGVQVMFHHGPATELAFSVGTWLEPYKASIVVPIASGFRFQVRRSNGWLFAPSLLVSVFSVAVISNGQLVTVPVVDAQQAQGGLGGGGFGFGGFGK